MAEVLWLTVRLAGLTTIVLLLLATPLAWWLALPRGLGVAGIVWAVIIASLISAGLLAGRFWILARRPI